MRWTSWTILTSVGAVSVSLKRRDCANRAAGLVPGHAPDLGLPVVAGVLLGPGHAVDVAAVPAAQSSAGRGQGRGVPQGVGAAALGPEVLSAGAVLARPSSADRDPSHARGPVPEAHLQSGVPRADLQAGHDPGQSQSRKASPGVAASPPRPTTATTPRRVPVPGLVRARSLQSKTTTTIPTTVEATCMLLFHVFCTACPATVRCVLALTLSCPYLGTVHSNLVAVHFIYCLNVIKAIVRVTCVASLCARRPMPCSVDICLGYQS